MKHSTLKPGLLVSLKTSVRGAVGYERRDLEMPHTNSRGENVARWETLRVISDVEDYESAKKARSKARSLITGVCCASSFGMLCPNADEGKLEEAIKEARAVAHAHNESSGRSRVEVYVLVGRVAQDDVEAAKAIGAEVRELLDAMKAGIAAAKPEAIREAANKARELGGMLSENVAGHVTEAIASARKAAREIVARVEKEGEEAAKVVAEISLEKIEKARFAFLDLEAGAVEAAPAPVSRALDLGTEVEGGERVAPVAPAAPARSLEVS